MAPRTHAADLDRVYLLWRDRSASRWAGLLGDDAGDLLTEVWLRLEKVQAGFVHTSDQATLRYIESVAGYVLKDRRRVETRRRELFAGALELGVRGLTARTGQESDIHRVMRPVEPPVDMETVIGSSRFASMPMLQRPSQRRSRAARRQGRPFWRSVDCIGGHGADYSTPNTQGV